MNHTKRSLFAALFLTHLVAVLLAFNMTRDHYQFLSGKRVGNTYCNVSSLINCDAVAASPFAKLGGITLSSWGVAYHLFVLTALVLILIHPGTAAALQTTQGLLLFSSLASLYSVILLLISYFWLHAICLSCSVWYGLNILSLLFTYRLCAQKYWLALMNGARALISLKPSWPIQLVLWAFLWFGGVYFWDWQLNKKSLVLPPEVQTKWREILKNSPARSIEPSTSPQKGATSPRLTIVEFSDFGCQYCRRAAFLTSAVLHNYQDSVALAFKHYPLDNECNSNMDRNVHPNACLVARGSICANQQQAFWQYHDAVFSQLSPFTPQTATEVAKSLNLDMQRFDTCMHSAESYRELAKDIADAGRLGISGTPAFLFNGRRIDGMLSAPVLKLLIEESLKLK